MKRFHLHHEAAADSIKGVGDNSSQDSNRLSHCPLGEEGSPLLILEQHALGCVVEAKVGAAVHYDALRTDSANISMDMPHALHDPLLQPATCYIAGSLQDPRQSARPYEAITSRVGACCPCIVDGGYCLLNVTRALSVAYDPYEQAQPATNSRCLMQANECSVTSPPVAGVSEVAR